MIDEGEGGRMLCCAHQDLAFAFIFEISKFGGEAEAGSHCVMISSAVRCVGCRLAGQREGEAALTSSVIGFHVVSLTL